MRQFGAGAPAGDADTAVHTLSDEAVGSDGGGGGSDPEGVSDLAGSMAAAMRDFE